MTLFIQTRKRVLEINDAYIMALSLLIFFTVGKIFKAVIEKQKRNNAKNIKIVNPRGGSLGLEFSDDTELANTILSCIDDNERYLVKHPELTKIVFALVKAKIKKESLILTPNMMRFLALKLINNDQTVIVKIGNIVASSNNRARFFSRVIGSAIIGFVGAFLAGIPYIILMFLLYDATENCGYKCSDYFEKLPKEGPHKVYGKESTGHIFIAGNDDARQLEIYIPSGATQEVSVSSNGELELKTTKTYSKVRKKAKVVKFSDFKKIDPVLSNFENLPEPEVP
uniref:hypothetical protein n=1 Tax=Navicula avium TaxID=2018708 RepID=UPI0021821826|nr:hypothetical protein N4L39_pgp092 [Haslea avium]YP_010472028.1 hypothetical protein N4L39_pgp026 [Haslea avium]UVG41427.1 hypothetical protein [Haslea avium]UVG41493.1 hypothetical protein [Haslea avium]